MSGRVRERKCQGGARVGGSKERASECGEKRGNKEQQGQRDVLGDEQNHDSLLKQPHHNGEGLVKTSGETSLWTVLSTEKPQS